MYDETKWEQFEKKKNKIFNYYINKITWEIVY